MTNIIESLARHIWTQIVRHFGVLFLDLLKRHCQLVACWNTNQIDYGSISPLAFRLLQRRDRGRCCHAHKHTHYVSRISPSSVHEGYRYGNIVSWVCSNVNHSATLYHTLCLINHCIPSSLTLRLNSESRSIFLSNSNCCDGLSKNYEEGDNSRFKA